MKRKKKKRNLDDAKEVPADEDIVEDLVLTSDEDESDSDASSAGEDGSGKPVPQEQVSKKQKQPTHILKKNVKSRAKRSKKRKTAT